MNEVRITNDTVVGHKTTVVDVTTGEDISNRVQAVEIMLAAGTVNRVTLHTVGTLDVLAEVERIIEPCEHCRREP